MTVTTTRSATVGDSPGLAPYAAHVLAELRKRLPWERVFLATVEEVFASLSPVLEQNPRYQASAILERIVEPERTISFRLSYTDDQRRPHVCRAFRVQFNSALGPYKGGTRFHSSVDLDSLKALAFEQTFKNALTGLSLGSGKGGADVSFRDRSSDEMMRVCQAYMSELYRHIGPETDIPAGDIGVSTREIGYLYGQYKRLARPALGAITGKGVGWGGSRLRSEATGFGVVYFADEVLRRCDESIEGATICVSGFGNVAWGVVCKANALGGKVVTLSGPDGFIFDPDGVRGEKVDFMLAMRASGADIVRPYAERFGVLFEAGKRPWGVPCDVAIPCAIQGELEVDDARALVNAGCRYLIEGANMPTTWEAVQIIQQSGVVYAPGKAANAGGVAVSGLEMAQNRSGELWTETRVDDGLRCIMRELHAQCCEAAEQYGVAGNYLAGANIGGFVRVADAMVDQGTA